MMEMSQLHAVRWKLLSGRERLRVRTAATYVPLTLADAMRQLCDVFDGDIDAFERACQRWRRSPSTVTTHAHAGRRSTQTDAVRSRLVVSDAQLTRMAPTIPLPALRARLQQRRYDVAKLQADINTHPFITANTTAHYTDLRDAIVEVKWSDGTLWVKGR